MKFQRLTKVDVRLWLCVLGEFSEGPKYYELSFGSNSLTKLSLPSFHHQSQMNLQNWNLGLICC